MKFKIFTFIYKNLAKPIFFLFDPELIHNSITSLGEISGNISPINNLLKSTFAMKNKKLHQNIAGINFTNPIGLAAGFDYFAKLTQILPSMGFGFQTIGTITYGEYEGNPKPRLGRLPESKSLMVNKGYKNKGAIKTVQKLTNKNFVIPVGISIGKTNTRKKETQEEAVEDIISAFKIFESATINNSYYELNISCPNLYGNISFYPPKNLNELLTAVDKLKIQKPIFIKMPINETDSATKKMLDVIVKHKIKGVIFGNLQKDRNDKSLLKQEVKKFKVGNFSGKPTEKRSNELIKLAFKNYGKKLIIIGCGGIFSAEDAYLKIKLGASLVQLITGLIFEGPTLVAQINNDLPKLLQKDGFKTISEAIGKDNF